MMNFYSRGMMMGPGGFQGYELLAFITWVVWLMVGILLLVWLGKQISKK